eukprot:GHUV01004237.1.p1 GENE.GHUV01004237.1~~GHUV01004237.1.p1  ORF type:complete len:324 (+),score=96.62 GHUV01004237.1:213-1184(+)
MGSDHHAALSAHLYDAVGEIWLQLFGEHVHVGHYPAGYPGSRNSKTWQQAQLDHVDAVLEFAGVQQAEKLLDLGCGYGGTAVHITEHLKCKTIGINISPFQVQAANRLARRHNLSRQQASFVVGDALQPHLRDASFDLVISVEAAAYMPDKQQFVQQMARLCAPGGTVILVDFCRAPGEVSKSLATRLAQMDGIFATPGNWHSPQQYKQYMSECGLRVMGDADWTHNICGFWNVGLWELLLRSSRPGLNFIQWFIEFAIRGLTCLWLLLTGGTAVLKMTYGYLSGQQKRVVQGGLDSRVLEYHVIVAKKPLAAAAPLGAELGN